MMSLYFAFMKCRIIWIILGIIILIGIGIFLFPSPIVSPGGDNELILSPNLPRMNITSPAFQHNGSIPSLYTCDGKNINPPLIFSDIPEQAKSLVLIMDDPDVPPQAGVPVWDHWIVFNIPPTVTTVEEGKNPKGVLGKNTSGKLAYGGPCPPDREHRYFFKLYALDTMLSLPAGSTKKEVEEAMKGHVIAKGELIGLYNRKR
jgi:hypothetical protein